jgi:hypothetical protein
LERNYPAIYVKEVSFFSSQERIFFRRRFKEEIRTGG